MLKVTHDLIACSWRPLVSPCIPGDLILRKEDSKQIAATDIVITLSALSTQAGEDRVKADLLHWILDLFHVSAKVLRLANNDRL